VSWLDAGIDSRIKLMSNVQRGGCLEVSTLTKIATPVDKGDLRKSLTPSIGEVRTSDDGGDISVVTSQLKAGDTYNFATAKPYAKRIEYEGHSQQAPAGMFRVSAAQWQRIIRDMVRKYR